MIMSKMERCYSLTYFAGSWETQSACTSSDIHTIIVASYTWERHCTTWIASHDFMLHVGSTSSQEATPAQMQNSILCYIFTLQHILALYHHYVKAQRLSWFGHVHRKPETSIVRKIYKWQPYLTRPAGRPKHRWDDDVRNDLRRMKLFKWSEQAQDRLEWKKTVEKSKTLHEL